jgi:hypothetical protein
MNLVEIEMVSEVIFINRSVSYGELASAFSALLGINEDLVFITEWGTRMAGVPDNTLVVCEVYGIDQGDFPLGLTINMWSKELSPPDKMPFFGSLCEQLGCFALVERGPDPDTSGTTTLVRRKGDYQLVRMDMSKEGAVILEYL